MRVVIKDAIKVRDHIINLYKCGAVGKCANGMWFLLFLYKRKVV